MTIRKIAIFCAVGIIGILAFSAFSQDQTFADPNVDYSFVLPEAKWKMTVKPSATSPNVEYVYGDRRDTHLDVRKLTVAKDAIMPDIVQDEDRRQFLRRGYIAGREENFVGFLRGTVFNFEYTEGGYNKSGRFYFLRANPTTVFILRFTGQRELLRGIRNQTDSIVRTFSVKQ